MEVSKVSCNMFRGHELFSDTLHTLVSFYLLPPPFPHITLFVTVHSAVSHGSWCPTLWTIRHWSPSDMLLKIHIFQLFEFSNKKVFLTILYAVTDIPCYNKHFSGLRWTNHVLRLEILKTISIMPYGTTNSQPYYLALCHCSAELTLYCHTEYIFYSCPLF